MRTSLSRLLQKALKDPQKIPPILASRITNIKLAVHNFFGRSDFFVRYLRAPVVRAFNRLFYKLRSNTFDSTFFMGKHVLKFPTDLWTYQELIFERRPDVIIETGVFLGGSTYYLAKLMQQLGHGRVIAADITLDHADPDLNSMENVTLLEGDTGSPEMFERIRKLIQPHERVMVILDSDHATEHVLREMNLLSNLVSDGQYLVVEDAIIEYVYPVFCRNGPGKAIKQFLSTHPEFSPEYYWNRFLLTHNPGGYLLKNEQVRFSKAEDCYRPLRLWLPNTPAPKLPWFKNLNQNRENSSRYR